MRDLMQTTGRAARLANRRKQLRRKSCDQLLIPGDLSSACRNAVVATDQYGEVCACAHHRRAVFVTGGIDINLWPGDGNITVCEDEKGERT